MNKVSLFAIDRVAFEIFGWPVAWYGIILTTGIVLAFLYLYYNNKTLGTNNEDFFYSVFIYAVITAIIGARVVYVLANNDLYGYFPVKNWDDFVELFAIWNGGLTIIGAIMFGMVGVHLCSRKYKIPTFDAYDLIAPCMLIGQIVGRWGNFVNQEAYGGVVTNEALQKFPFAVFIEDTASWHYATFLYESLLNFVALVFIIILGHKKVKTGIITFVYLGWYGFVRAIMEFTRMDAVVKDWGVFGEVNITQLLCVLTFLAAIVMLILIQKNIIFLKKRVELITLESNNKDLFKD